MQVKDMIFKILKWKNGSYMSVDDIFKVIMEADPNVYCSEIETTLDELTNKRWINKIAHPITSVIYYSINRYLDPVMPADNLRPSGEFYEGMPSISIPEQWMNPDIQYVARRDQRSRQICVGCSGAYARDLDYISLTRTVPLK